ncbi:hypothetical protein ScPMuIL_006293 [Solemya velum]
MSAGRTVLQQNVASDRIVSKYPQPFHPDSTPYQSLNFHPKVKAACSDNKTGRAGLKICKGVLVGDVAVGKTSLVHRFCHNVFERDYKATIGVDFEVEKFSILSSPFTLQLWDTAGQERFKCIAASYYRGANVVIVVFDLSDATSLSNVEKWMDDAYLLSEASYETVESQAIGVANSLQAEYWALSSKTGENVKEFFFRAVSLTFEFLVLRELEPNGSGESKQIGSDLLKIERERTEVYEERKKKDLKCC